MHEHEQPGQHGGQHHGRSQPDEQPLEPTMGGHGMLMLGQDVLYMSHLPMFMQPHNFQVLLEVDFDGDVRRLLGDYREAAGGGMNTWDPRHFPIAELDPAGGGPARDSMVGNLVRGHFERGGTPIATESVARVLDVLHSVEVDIDARLDEGRELTYVCFGRGGRLHSTHAIPGPDLDQILTPRRRGARGRASRSGLESSRCGTPRRSQQVHRRRNYRRAPSRDVRGHAAAMAGVAAAGRR